MACATQGPLPKSSPGAQCGAHTPPHVNGPESKSKLLIVNQHDKHNARFAARGVLERPYLSRTGQVWRNTSAKTTCEILAKHCPSSQNSPIGDMLRRKLLCNMGNMAHGHLAENQGIENPARTYRSQSPNAVVEYRRCLQPRAGRIARHSCGEHALPEPSPTGGESKGWERSGELRIERRSYRG